MIKTTEEHKQIIIELLSKSFDDNRSVNWIVAQDTKREERIKALIDYSFDFCINSGAIYLTDNLKGVVMAHRSEDKLPVLEEAYLTLKFVSRVVGIGGIRRALKREKFIKSFHPENEEYIYIWFIGVDESQQGKGVGSRLLQQIVERSREEQLPIYLETSVEKNLPFYEKQGFEIYHVADENIFGYKLYFLRRLLTDKGD